MYNMEINDMKKNTSNYGGNFFDMVNDSVWSK